MESATSRTPTQTALTVARNAVPEVEAALELMRVSGLVRTGEVVEGHGVVTVTLRSTEAYDLARWARNRATQDERARGNAERQAK